MCSRPRVDAVLQLSQREPDCQGSSERLSLLQPILCAAAQIGCSALTRRSAASRVESEHCTGMSRLPSRCFARLMRVRQLDGHGDSSSDEDYEPALRLTRAQRVVCPFIALDPRSVASRRWSSRRPSTPKRSELHLRLVDFRIRLHAGPVPLREPPAQAGAARRRQADSCLDVCCLRRTADAATGGATTRELGAGAS